MGIDIMDLSPENKVDNVALELESKGVEVWFTLSLLFPWISPRRSRLTTKACILRSKFCLMIFISWVPVWIPWLSFGRVLAYLGDKGDEDVDLAIHRNGTTQFEHFSWRLSHSAMPTAMKHISPILGSSVSMKYQGASGHGADEGLRQTNGGF